MQDLEVLIFILLDKFGSRYPLQKKEPKPVFVPKIVTRPFQPATPTRPAFNSTRYEIGQLLGRGGFASCFKAVSMETKKEYAIKVISKSSDNMKKSGSKQRLNNEIQLMSSLRHEHIVRLIDNFQDDQNFYLILDLCSKISLTEMVRKRSRISEIQVKYFIRQLIKAVIYLKQCKVIHRDIKTPNILLDENLIVKLGDFGLAISADSVDHQRYSMCGTPSYMAPEVVKKQKYSYEIDMWCVGVVAFTLLFGAHPFARPDQKQTYEKIKQLNYEFPIQAKKTTSIASRNFVSKIFVLDPKERLTPQQALCHDFLKESVPACLPLQCYEKQVPIAQLLTYCKTEHVPIYRQSKSKQSNNSGIRNRTITSYCFKEGSQKNLFSTVKKQSLQRKKRMDVQCEENQKEERKTASIDKFQVQINFHQSTRIPNNNLNTQQASPLIIKQQLKLQPLLQLQPVKKQYEQPQPQQNSQQQQYQQQYNQPHTTTLLQIYQYLSQKWNNQPYIYQFADNSQKYGLCYMLSNGIKIISFNDHTSMAINQSTKTVMYAYLNNDKENSGQFGQEKDRDKDKRVIYKINSNNMTITKLEENKPQNSNSNKSQQYIKKQKQFCTLEFKTHEPPKDIPILKKYFMLKQYCRTSTKKYPSQQLNEQWNNGRSQQINLLQCLKLVKKWGCKRQSQQYIFITAKYVQVIFPDFTQYFINRKKPEVIIINEIDCYMKTLDLPLNRNKKRCVSKKQSKQIGIVGKFMRYFINLKKSERKAEANYCQDRNIDCLVN